MLANSRKILTVALAAVAFTIVSLATADRAVACPGGYFKCGGVCCPR